MLEAVTSAVSPDEVHDVKIGKEDIKLSMFANEMTIYKITQNLQKKIEIMSEFSKVTR